MSLQRKAARLSAALNAILEASETFALRNADVYIAGIVRELRPEVVGFTDAVERTRDKEAASEALKALARHIAALSSASTKGERNIFPATDDALTLYWDLHTIFREARYRNESL